FHQVRAHLGEQRAEVNQILLERVAEVDGPEAGLSLVDSLDLPRYQVFHAVRADLLRRLGRTEEARAAYSEAIALKTSDVVAARAMPQSYAHMGMRQALSGLLDSVGSVRES
ncbi:hypothetical protein ACFQ1S_37125, partial [Kibdelosporangium lantanae]